MFSLQLGDHTWHFHVKEGWKDWGWWLFAWEECGLCSQTVLMPQWNITKFQTSRTNPREQDLYRTASWYSLDLYRPILTDLGLGRQSAAVSWIGDICITAMRAQKTRLLRATGLAGCVFADVPAGNCTSTEIQDNLCSQHTAVPSH